MGFFNVRPPSDELLARQRELNRQWHEKHNNVLHAYSHGIFWPPLPPLPKYRTNAIGIPLIRAALEGK